MHGCNDVSFANHLHMAGGSSWKNYQHFGDKNASASSNSVAFLENFVYGINKRYQQFGNTSASISSNAVVLQEDPAFDLNEKYQHNAFCSDVVLQEEPGIYCKEKYKEFRDSCASVSSSDIILEDNHAVDLTFESPPRVPRDMSDQRFEFQEFLHSSAVGECAEETAQINLNDRSFPERSRFTFTKDIDGEERAILGEEFVRNRLQECHGIDADTCEFVNSIGKWDDFKSFLTFLWNRVDSNVNEVWEIFVSTKNIITNENISQNNWPFSSQDRSEIRTLNFDHRLRSCEPNSDKDELFSNRIASAAEDYLPICNVRPPEKRNSDYSTSSKFKNFADNEASSSATVRNTFHQPSENHSNRSVFSCTGVCDSAWLDQPRRQLYKQSLLNNGLPNYTNIGDSTWLDQTRKKLYYQSHLNNRLPNCTDDSGDSASSDQTRRMLYYQSLLNNRLPNGTDSIGNSACSDQARNIPYKQYLPNNCLPNCTDDIGNSSAWSDQTRKMLYKQPPPYNRLPNCTDDIGNSAWSDQIRNMLYKQSPSNNRLPNSADNIDNKQSLLNNQLPVFLNERPFRCLKCNKRFEWSADLLRHITTHTKTGTLNCKTTSRNTSVDESSIYQMSKNPSTESKFGSMDGDSSFPEQIKTYGDTASERLATEISKSKPFSCDKCKKTFSNKCRLKNHLPVHSNERKFSCPKCKRSYKWRKDLKKHIEDTHVYKATSVNTMNQSSSHQVFDQKNDFDQLSLHSYDRKLNCPKCKTRFKRRKSLIRHMDSLHACKPTSIYIPIDHSFSHQISDLTNDTGKLSLHSNKRKFNCLKCKRRFKLVKDLKKHMEAPHP